MSLDDIFNAPRDFDRTAHAAAAFEALADRKAIFGTEIDIVAKVPGEKATIEQATQLYYAIHRDNRTIHQYLRDHAEEIRPRVFNTLVAMMEGNPAPETIPLIDDPRRPHEAALIIVPDETVTGRQWAAALCGFNPQYTAEMPGYPTEWQYYMAVRECALASGKTQPQAEFIATALYRKILGNEEVPQGRKVINAFNAVMYIGEQIDHNFSYHECVRAISAARQIPDKDLSRMTEKEIVAAAVETFCDPLDTRKNIYDANLVRLAIEERTRYLAHAPDACAMRSILQVVMHDESEGMLDNQKEIAKGFIHSSTRLDRRTNAPRQPADPAMGWLVPGTSAP